VAGWDEVPRLGRVTDRVDLAVVGGGIIGLACAWRAAQRGLAVRLLDGGGPGSASYAAAGMLAPASELGESARRLVPLSRASYARYPAFVEELEQATAAEVAFRLCGSLVVALDEDAEPELGALHALQQEEGLESELLDAAACRALEPRLAGETRAGLWTRDEGQVDPRALVAALREACVAAGVRIDHGAHVGRALLDGDRLTGVATANEEIRADHVLLAAGAHSGAADWLPEAVRPPVEPVKGQLLRARLPEPPATHLVRSASAYVVPRPDGRVVVGATSERSGFDESRSPEVETQLLAAARRFLPAIVAVADVEHCVGFRPGTPDGLPIVGATALDGLLVATGHYRNGILLAPVTADAIAALLTGAEPPPELAAADPRRFA
jgi:glycine oxidase